MPQIPSIRDRFPPLRCAVLSLGLILVGCVRQAPLESPKSVKTPDAWSTSIAGSSEESEFPEAWWTAFGIPRLDALVEEAFTGNPDLRSIGAAVEASLAQARIAGAARRPQVEANLGAARQQQVFLGLPIPTDDVLKSRWTAYDPRISVAWEADLWGRLRAGRRAAVADAEAATQDFAAARWSIAAQTARSYFDLVEARRQVELAEATADSRLRTVETAQARYRSGVGEALDVRLARSAEASTRGVLEQRRRVLDLRARQLEALLGRYPAGDLAENEDLPELPPLNTDVLPADLVARRPDLRAAERRLAAAGWRVSEAKRALYPRLRFSADAGSSAESVGDLLGGDFTVWSLAGGLLQPLFQGGRLRAAVDFAESTRERALALYVQSALRAFVEVESALAADRSLRLEEEAAVDAVRESTAAADLALERYGIGVGDYLLVLESQRQVFDAESALLAVRRLRWTNRATLYAALAGSP